MSPLNESGTIWLDSARRDPDSGNDVGLLFSDPREVVAADDARSLFRLFEKAEEASLGGFHAVLLVWYEAAYALHRNVFTAPDRQRLAWLGVYDEPEQIPADEVGTLLDEGAEFQVRGSRLGVSFADYNRGVAAIREAIRVGDVYQVNYTMPLTFRLEGDVLGFYGALRENQKVAYGMFGNLGDQHVLSLSPELFFRIEVVDDNRVITTRPMKGTVRRGRSRAEDDALAESLEADPKNRAENLMIVDLLRNDLARVAKPGSVRVPDLYSIERYESVTQMTSTVEATLRPETTLSSLFKALFPCGSVTGAPKWSAMTVIREIEAAPRGVYCGAIGYLGPGSAAFSVPIRTIEIKDGSGTLGLGSGIIWDSVAEKEYAECLLKAKFLTNLIN